MLKHKMGKINPSKTKICCAAALRCYVAKIYLKVLHKKILKHCLAEFFFII